MGARPPCHSADASRFTSARTCPVPLPMAGQAAGTLVLTTTGQHAREGAAQQPAQSASQLLRRSIFTRAQLRRTSETPRSVSARQPTSSTWSRTTVQKLTCPATPSSRSDCAGRRASQQLPPHAARSSPSTGPKRQGRSRSCTSSSPARSLVKRSSCPSEVPACARSCSAAMRPKPRSTWLWTRREGAAWRH